MAFEEKKYLDLEGLKSYDAKIKAKMAADDKVLDNAINAVNTKVEQEKTDRTNAVNAINTKLGDLPENKTVAEAIADAQTAATYDDTQVKKDISDNKTAIDAINNVDTGILKQAKDYTDELAAKVGEVEEGKNLANIVAENANAAKITLTTAETATEGYLKTYVISQGTAEVGKIDIPKELVVTAGEVVVNPDGQPEGTYIKLSIANQENPIFINVKDLVDVYTAEADAAQVQLSISDTNVISAVVVAGSINTTELANSAVTTAKIADGNVTRAKIDAAFEAEIKALEDAVGKGGSVATQIEEAINKLDANVDSTNSALVSVHVDQADGVVTAVTVTEDLANAFDAKGAASDVQTNLDNLANGAIKDNADAIAAINDGTTGILAQANQNIDNLEKSFVEISTVDIDALFPTA